jgi:hypothetical protein
MESALWNQASSLFGALQELRISAVAASRPGGKAGTACLDLRRHSMRLCFPITSGRLKGPGIHPVCGELLILGKSVIRHTHQLRLRFRALNSQEVTHALCRPGAADKVAAEPAKGTRARKSA